MRSALNLLCLAFAGGRGFGDLLLRFGPVGHTLARLGEAASIRDHRVKGLKHPHRPLDPCDGPGRLALMVVQHIAAQPSRHRRGCG